MDTSALEAPARSSAADRVYRHVRAAILSRRFADNALLAEGQLADETGVSRTPVREALLRLEGEGMVRLLPKRGALVLPVTAQEWRDVIATRRLVERHCARSLIAAGRGPDVARMLSAPLDALRTAAAAADLGAYVTADRDFHATLVAAAGNGILVKLYGSLRDRQLRVGAANLLAPAPADAAEHDGTGGGGARLDTARMDATIADHEGIAAAIRAEDAELADRLIDAHLDHAERALGQS